jgi:hypothetical protein
VQEDDRRALASLGDEQLEAVDANGALFHGRSFFVAFTPIMAATVPTVMARDTHASSTDEFLGLTRSYG